MLYSFLYNINTSGNLCAGYLRYTLNNSPSLQYSINKYILY